MSHVFRIFLLLVGLVTVFFAIPMESSMNNQIFFKTRPWCIGRFLLNRPVSSQISDEFYRYRGEKIETMHDISTRKFNIMVGSREAEMKNNRRINPGRRNAETSHPWIEKAFSPTSASRVFIYQRGVADGVKMPFESEGYIYRGNTLFKTAGGFGENALDKTEGFYENFYRRIKARDNWTVPAESGFCFDGGIVTGSSAYTEEVSQSFALMPGRPALLLIKMRDSVSEDRDYPLTRDISGLRARLDSRPGRYRILRQGKRPVAGMDAEEVLFALHDGPVSIYQFYLLAPGNPDTLAQPHTEIQLLLGAPPRSDLPADQATSPVDEAGALQLWDALLNSLRLRPGAV